METGSDKRDKIEFWREEVLRRAEQALQGRLVGLWQETENGLVPVAVGSKRALPPTAAEEITRALKAWAPTRTPTDSRCSPERSRPTAARMC